MLELFAISNHSHKKNNYARTFRYLEQVSWSLGHLYFTREKTRFLEP